MSIHNNSAPGGSLPAVAARLRELLGPGIEVQPRPPLDHQSNALYDAWLSGQHLIVKDFICQLYLALFPIFWLSVMCRAGVRRAAEGRLAGWTANALPINARLRRFLARAQAWPSPDFTAQLRSLEGVIFFPASPG